MLEIQPNSNESFLYAGLPTETAAELKQGEYTQYKAPISRKNIPALLGSAILSFVTTTGLPTTASASWIIEEGMVENIEQFESEILRSKVIRYRSLDANWDGEDGRAPSSMAVAEALEFLNLLPTSTPIPESYVAGDGEVGFVWRDKNGSFVDVSFLGDGFIYYYASLPISDIEIDDAIQFSGLSMPADLSDAIRSL